MPSYSTPIVINGQVVGIACHRRQRMSCSTPGCRNDGTLQCDYAVTTRAGKGSTCDRYVCKGCALRVGPNKDYCAAHGRLSQAAK